MYKRAASMKLYACSFYSYILYTRLQYQPLKNKQRLNPCEFSRCLHSEL